MLVPPGWFAAMESKRLEERFRCAGIQKRLVLGALTAVLIWRAP